MYTTFTFCLTLHTHTHTHTPGTVRTLIWHYWNVIWEQWFSKSVSVMLYCLHYLLVSTPPPPSPPSHTHAHPTHHPPPHTQTGCTFSIQVRTTLSSAEALEHHQAVIVRGYLVYALYNYCVYVLYRSFRGWPLTLTTSLMVLLYLSRQSPAACYRYEGEGKFMGTGYMDVLLYV